MNYAKEVASMEQLGILMTLDAYSLACPNSVGLEALEANLMGGTSISTEGLVDRIKERASTIMSKIGKYFSMAVEILKNNKVWVAGTLVAVAGFVTAVVALYSKSRKGDANTAAKEYGPTIRQLYSQTRTVVKESRKSLKADKAEAKHIRRARNARAESIRAERRARDAAKNLGLETSDKQSGAINKIIGGLKALAGYAKKAVMFIPEILKRKKESASTEDWLSNADEWTKRHRVLTTLAFFFLPYAWLPIAFIKVVALIRYCKAPKKQAETVEQEHQSEAAEH